MFRCHVCGSLEAKEEHTDEVFQIERKHLLVENVPALVCVRCGEKTFSRETTEKVRSLIHDKAQPTKSIPMEVFTYA
ncbi:YgiT-type zinc finger protein [candidate division KSB1 bacterium]|nr:YgiT-type zinc finger protein [candidate division KSB1 bacterium]